MLNKISDWITQKEASELMGKSLASVCQLVRNKRVRSMEVYGKRLVYQQDVLNFKSIKSGRPRKNES